ncbi:MAG: SPOR domain-containing protein [Magnetococcales bacterium]|nr:SPOR domain-containing protein [Magnetococcales bacterium]
MPKFSLTLPPLVRTALGYLPWVLVVALLAGNGVALMKLLRGGSEPAVWVGPTLPGKVMELPSRPVEEKKEEEKKPEKLYADEPLRDLVVKDEPQSPTGGAAATASASAEKKGGEAKKGSPPSPSMAPVASDSPSGKGYVVQVGSFVLKLGVKELVNRLKKNNIHPRVENQVELTQLNSVQAGPYPKMEQAKEAEAKLRAGGLDVSVEETWEGYVITLGKFYLLGYAVQAREQGERLQVKPLRMVKMEAPVEVQKVLLGPFPTKEAAKEISMKIAHLGFASPVIKDAAKAGSPIVEGGAMDREEGKGAHKGGEKMFSPAPGQREAVKAADGAPPPAPKPTPKPVGKEGAAKGGEGKAKEPPKMPDPKFGPPALKLGPGSSEEPPAVEDHSGAG